LHLTVLNKIEGIRQSQDLFQFTIWLDPNIIEIQKSHVILLLHANRSKL